MYWLERLKRELKCLLIVMTIHLAINAIWMSLEWHYYEQIIKSKEDTLVALIYCYFIYSWVGMKFRNWLLD